MTQIDDGSELIQEWKMFGPFYRKNEYQAIDAHLKEAVWTHASDLDEIFKNSTSRTLRNCELSKLQVPETGLYESGIDFAKLEDTEGHPDRREGVVYVGCIFNASTNKSVYLSTTSDDNITIYLNGRQVFEYDSPEGRGLHLYDDCNKIELYKGENVIVFRIGNRGGGWAFSARIDGDEKAVIKNCLIREKRFLSSAIVSDIKNARCLIRGAPKDHVYPFNIKRVSTLINSAPTPSESTKQSTISQSGLFLATLDYEGLLVTEHLIVGEPEDVATTVSGRRFSEPNDLELYKESHWRRLSVLLRPESRRYDDVNWQRKITQAISALHYAASFDARPEAFTTQRDLHFNGFVSQIDGSKQFYRLSIPPYAQDQRALIVILPVVFEVSRPFIESSQVSDHLWAEQLADAANRAGAGLLWSGYRGKPMGHPLDFAHFEEVLNAVRREYDFDPRRVSLLGVCSSGVTACMMTVRWPQRFAAIGLTNPFLSWFGYNRDYLPLLANPDFRQYVISRDPMRTLANSGANTPIWIIQTDNDPQHGPKAQPDRFVELARIHGYPVRYDVELDKYHEQLNVVWRDRLIPWLASQHRASAASNVGTNAPTYLSLSEAVAKPFVVVVGTAGTADDRRRMSVLADQFQAAWRRENFASCRITTDIELTRFEEESMNLVLLGNERQNMVWRRKVPPSNVSLTADNVKLFERTWNGKNLWLQAILNDEKSAKNIILIGSYDLSSPFPDLNISTTGWFGYAIWDSLAGTGIRGLIDAGHFGKSP